MKCKLNENKCASVLIRLWLFSAIYHIVAKNEYLQLSSHFHNTFLKIFTVTCLPNEFECATGYGCLDPALYCNVAGECMDRSDENVNLCGKLFDIPPYSNRKLPHTEMASLSRTSTQSRIRTAHNGLIRLTH